MYTKNYYRQDIKVVKLVMFETLFSIAKQKDFCSFEYKIDLFHH